MARVRAPFKLWAAVAILAAALSPAAALTQNAPPTHVAGSGVRLTDQEWGTVNFRLWTYVRYLNQQGLDATFTDSFGTVKMVQNRQDLQLNKVNVYFFGWLLDPKLRYLSYVWTSNASQGLGAQVVVGGNLQYVFSERFALGFGINGLPGTRSVEGNSPFWLGADHRLIADEFFRPSYTTALFARGSLTERLTYQAALGNNLSQLGVDAGQLDNDINTFSAALAWMPTTGEFGRGFGDFEQHERVATRVGGHYTRSDENRQSQPGTEAPENSQLRISDGNVIFTPGLFGPGIVITDATYQMAAFDAGIKRHGYALEGEFYWRRIDNLRGPGIDGLAFDQLEDRGFGVQASAMPIPKRLQLYASGSWILGEYGDPSDARLGVNWYPWATSNSVRWNNEVIYLRNSPVGALSLPYTVGGNGAVFTSNFEINF